MLELQRSRLELSTRWHCEMSLGWACIVAGRNKEPLGVFLARKGALGFPDPCLVVFHRINVIFVAFSSMETLIFVCLLIHVFAPL